VEEKGGMMKEEIGLIHGVSENRDRTWERQVNGATFVFSKTWEPKHKKFYYGCHTKADDGNGFYASSALDRLPSKRGLRLQQLHPIFLTINVSNKSGHLLFARS
jgi:hypothetical protein